MSRGGVPMKSVEPTSGERGTILVLAALLMVAVMGGLALAIDIAGLSRSKQHLQDSVDAAAIAGARELPNAALAVTTAQAMALANDPGLVLAASEITFWCNVGTDPSDPSQPDPVVVSAACNPTLSGAGTFGCRRGACIGPCTPSPTQRCNSLRIRAQRDRKHAFAPVIGVSKGSVSTDAAACWGRCGGTSTAFVDMAVIIDRSGSMSNADITNVKAAVDSMLDELNPQYQHVALGVLGFSSTASRLCTNGMRGRVPNKRLFSGNPVGPVSWVPVGLSSDYNNPDGSRNTASTLRRTVSCLERDSVGWGTDLSTPVTMAQQELVGPAGRAGAQKVIVLFTDGAANQPSSQTNPCHYAAQRAQAAKDAGTEIYTIGYGVDANSTCDDDDSPSPYGPTPSTGPWWWSRAGARPPVTQLLADMATPSTFDEDGCEPAENSDNDHFYCESQGTDLAPLFRRIGADIGASSRLIDPALN